MSISTQAKIDLLSDIDRSSVLAAGILFPDTFNRPFGQIHRQVFEIIDRRPGDPGYRPHKCIIAPRGVGKTSIGTLLVPTIAILLRRYRYIVVIGYNAGDAEEKTEELKWKLLDNKIVKALYGDIKTDKWAASEWIVNIGGEEIKIHPRGSGQPVRGRKFHDHRPGLIIVDDLEKTEETETEEQRAKKKTWFYGDVLNAIDRGKKFNPGDAAPWEILVVGTILHQDSLLINLDESDNWDSCRLEICDDSFNPNYEEFMDEAECRALYHQFKTDDELDVWYREYRNNPVPTGEDAAFQSKFFKYYGEADENLNYNPNVENLVIVDPSRTANPSSNPTGIVGVGVNMDDNRVYVRECISKRMHVEEMYDRIAETIVRLDARLLAVEITGLHEFITNPLKQFLATRGINIEFMELQARGGGSTEKGKVSRVRSLVDFYRSGVIYHNPQVCDVLEQQLQAFPKAKEWSVMDPFGYLPEILEKGLRFFTYPGSEERENRKDVEAEYRELERMYDEDDELYNTQEFEIDFGVPL